MAHIIKDADINNEPELVKGLVHLASAELTRTKDIEPDWQTSASKVLVALGSKAGDEVMAELLQKLVPGVLPHYFVVLTLANLATENDDYVVKTVREIESLGKEQYQDYQKGVFESRDKGIHAPITKKAESFQHQKVKTII
eukprot:gene4072-4625_t